MPLSSTNMEDYPVLFYALTFFALGFVCGIVMLVGTLFFMGIVTFDDPPQKEDRDSLVSMPPPVNPL